MQITTLDQFIAEFFNSLSVSINGKEWSYGNLILMLISIVLAVILSSFIGFEREVRGRSAGLRTHLLVAVGSCIIMFISIYGFPQLRESNRDPARLAAQVVTGIGFLGAGAIIHFGGGIKGLTTASTIWLVMAIGLACGSMNFILAIVGTIVVMVVLVSFRKIENIATKNNPMIFILADSSKPVMTELLATAKEFKCSVKDITTQIIQDGAIEKIQVTFKLFGYSKNSFDVEEFKKSLSDKINALDIQVLNHH